MAIESHIINFLWHPHIENYWHEIIWLSIESAITCCIVSMVTRCPRGIEMHHGITSSALARVLGNRSLLAWRECPRGSRPFSSVSYKRSWSRALALISSSFSPMITPRRRDLHPTLGAHVGAPLPPRGWHFPCHSRPARRRPLRSHGGTTGSCSRISYGSLSPHIVTNLWSQLRRYDWSPWDATR